VGGHKSKNAGVRKCPRKTGESKPGLARPEKHTIKTNGKSEDRRDNTSTNSTKKRGRDANRQSRKQTGRRRTTISREEKKRNCKKGDKNAGKNSAEQLTKSGTRGR